MKSLVQFKSEKEEKRGGGEAQNATDDEAGT